MDSIFDGTASRTWHIYWQAAVGRDLLATASLAALVRTRLINAHRQPGRELLYYLLTPSEIHLLTTLPAGESASAFAHGVANVVARWVRDVDGMPGPVFAGRYQARLIGDAGELRDELRVLAWRPVSLKLCVTPTRHAHSGLRIALGLSRVDGFHPGPLYRLFGGSTIEARTAIRTLLLGRPSELETLQWELGRGVALARGEAGPLGPVSRSVRGVAATLVAASASKSIEGALQLLEWWVQAKLQMQVGPSLALGRDHASAHARAIVAVLAVQCDLCPAAAVARHFKRSKATLCEQMSAAQARESDQRILRVPLEQLAEQALELAVRVSVARRGCPTTCAGDEDAGAWAPAVMVQFQTLQQPVIGE